MSLSRAPACARPSSAVITRPRGGPLQEAELQEVGLVDVLDRLRLLTEGDRKRRQPDRPAAELVDHDGREQVSIEPLEARAVDLE